MRVLRAFQVINKDGTYVLSNTYNEVDDITGGTMKKNAADSFYAVDPDLKAHIDAIEQYIIEQRYGQRGVDQV
ncbi:MAG: hypothetical protein PHR92_18075 [Lachnospiraceae bacterium]|nr:hypothetical protein [Lachnospiraceae bacterium]